MVKQKLKKMNIRYKFIYITFILIIVYFTTKIKANDDKKIIKILIKEPDMPETIKIEEWENNYTSLINNYFVEKNKNNSDLSNVEIVFEFFEYEYHYNGTYDKYRESSYYQYEKKLIDNINDDESEYDMIVLDDRLLLNDNTMLTSDRFLVYYDIDRPTYELFLDMSEYIKEDKLTFHDSKILKDGSRDGKIYGLPYEVDFDLLYYNTQNQKASNLVENMEKASWDELLSSIKSEPSYSLNLGLGDDDNLLNFFVEYISSHYNLSKDYDPDFYKLFYNQTSDELFTSFYNFFSLCTDNNVDDVLYLKQYEAFVSFMNEQSIFFKGKASHINTFSSLPGVSYTLPPKNKSTINEKYIAINNKSKIDPQILTEVALQLTSKDMQLLRAKLFGSIPTFDLSQKLEDSEINSYCQTHSNICSIMDKLDKIYIKDVFDTKYATSFFEVELILPNVIRYSLENNDMAKTVFALKNNDVLITMELGIYKMLSYIVTGIATGIAFIVMFLVNKHKKHPYLKVISPMFCNMIVFGCIMNIIKIVIRLPPYFPTKVKFYILYSTFATSLIYIPMFAVTFRIYRIYQSRSFLSYSLTNTRLLVFVIFFVTLSLGYRIYVVTCTGDFYYIPYGDLLEPRFPMYEYEGFSFDSKIYEIYLYVIVSIIINYINIKNDI